MICEHDTAEHIQAKVSSYFRNGAREVWLAYATMKSVQVWRGNRGVSVEGALTTDLLPGLTINLAEAFGV